MIDPSKIKSFWEARGTIRREISVESVSNLEEDPALLRIKMDAEIAQVIPRLHLDPSQSILDLGAGVGQWALRFAPHVNRVVAVEYASSQVEIGKKEIAEKKLANVEYVLSSAENFASEELFDIIFISGLFVYLVDEQAQKLLPRLSLWLKPHGMIFLRDGTSILPHRHYIDDKYSEVLHANYSAMYRTRQEYITMFDDAGYRLLEDGQMFPETSCLNKYPETRLRFYSFARK